MRVDKIVCIKGKELKMSMKSKISIVATAGLAVGAMALTLPSLAQEQEGAAATKPGVEAGMYGDKAKGEGANHEKPRKLGGKPEVMAKAPGTASSTKPAHPLTAAEKSALSAAKKEHMAKKKEAVAEIKSKKILSTQTQ